ncbi:MAG TPA: Hsp20 family protein [Cellvibrio sp.]|nr:Hsp20 family protein [Cellvibrio sp.]
MNTIDLSPLYRSTVGFDRLGSLLDSALRADQGSSFPPYNIEVTGENRYAITLAVAGFDQNDLDIQTERGLLSIRGRKGDNGKEEHRYLHQGIATRAFERKFSLADHVEVTGAQLNNGLLTVNLVKEIPETMKPRSIAIDSSNAGNTLQHKVASSNSESHKAA